MIFWRIVDNKLYPIEETNELGFEESEGFIEKNLYDDGILPVDEL